MTDLSEVHGRLSHTNDSKKPCGNKSKGTSKNRRCGVSDWDVQAHPGVKRLEAEEMSTNSPLPVEIQQMEAHKFEPKLSPPVGETRKTIVKPPKKRKGNELETDPQLGTVVYSQPSSIQQCPMQQPRQSPPTASQAMPTVIQTAPAPPQTPPTHHIPQYTSAGHSQPTATLTSQIQTASPVPHLQTMSPVQPHTVLLPGHQTITSVRQSPVHTNMPPVISLPGPPSPSSIKKPLIDLQEWKGHRVLAKKDDTYLPAVIKSVTASGDLGIQFDSGKNVTFFNNILEARNPYIVSDHSPLASMVHVDMTVCVRVNPDDSVFYPGRVVEKVERKGVPVSCCVVLDGQPKGGKGVWVTRANLRLLQPPWYEDLEEQEIMTITSRAQQVGYSGCAQSVLM